MKSYLKFATLILSFILSILFIWIMLLFTSLFIGLCIIVSPILILYGIYYITIAIYKEMMRYINQHTYTDYIEITDKDDK